MIGSIIRDTVSDSKVVFVLLCVLPKGVSPAVPWVLESVHTGTNGGGDTDLRKSSKG